MLGKQERIEAIKTRLRNQPKKFECTGCGQKMTVLVSLNCNCGGQIIPIKEAESVG